MSDEFLKYADLLSTSIIGIVAVIITWRYSHVNKRISNDSIKHQLFTDFNQRYSQLNHRLEEIAVNKMNWEMLRSNRTRRDHRNAVIDYLILCAEERYWFKKERIEPEVWKSWQAGMNYWYGELPALREAWEEEKKQSGKESYYLKEGEDLFGG